MTEYIHIPECILRVAVFENGTFSALNEIAAPNKIE